MELFLHAERIKLAPTAVRAVLARNNMLKILRIRKFDFFGSTDQCAWAPWGFRDCVMECQRLISSKSRVRLGTVQSWTSAHACIMFIPFAEQSRNSGGISAGYLSLSEASSSGYPSSWTTNAIHSLPSSLERSIAQLGPAHVDASRPHSHKDCTATSSRFRAKPQPLKGARPIITTLCYLCRV